MSDCFARGAKNRAIIYIGAAVVFACIDTVDDQN